MSLIVNLVLTSPDSSIRMYQQVTAQQQAQRLSVAYNNLGGILKMQGRSAEAIACYEHVALLQVWSPQQGGRVSCLARVYGALGPTWIVFRSFSCCTVCSAGWLTG